MHDEAVRGSRLMMVAEGLRYPSVRQRFVASVSIAAVLNRNG